MKYRSLTEWVDLHHTILSRSQWLYLDNTKLYIRLTKRYIDGVVTRTLDLATMSVTEKKRGQGIITKLVAEAEIVADKYGLVIYVENVLTERFDAWWVRRGYQPITKEYPRCFIRIKKAKNGLSTNI